MNRPFSDAFQASLLDATTFVPMVPPWDGLATPYFNVQGDGTAYADVGTTWGNGRVIVDVSGVPTGTQLSLIFDLNPSQEDTDNDGIGDACDPS